MPREDRQLRRGLLLRNAVDISTTEDDLLGLNADFYYSKTTDMLFDVPVSSVSGLTTSNMNIGSMQNKGVEL